MNKIKKTSIVIPTFIFASLILIGGLKIVEYKTFYNLTRSKNKHVNIDKLDGPIVTKVYYENSMRILRETQWKNGKRHGLETHYFENGLISDQITWVNGLRDGIWRRHNDKGHLTSSAIYKNDKVIEFNEY
jgi:antitoxin component YwqK of YwqJK toxin-antitoxin module